MPPNTNRKALETAPVVAQGSAPDAEILRSFNATTIGSAQAGRFPTDRLCPVMDASSHGRAETTTLCGSVIETAHLACLFLTKRV